MRYVYYAVDNHGRRSGLPTSIKRIAREQAWRLNRNCLKTRIIHMLAFAELTPANVQFIMSLPESE